MLTKADDTVTIWDTQTNEVSDLSVYGVGHKVGGYGSIINNSKIGDNAQWHRRALDFGNLGNPSPLINPLLTPTEYAIDSHLSWNNAQPSALVPVLVSTYRTISPSTSAPLRAWDDEVIAIRTDGLESKVWRFAHHRSLGTGWTDIPRGNVSQDGRFFLFQSNWERTLGAGRHDTFVVALTGETVMTSGGRQNVAWTNFNNAAVSGTTLYKTGGWSASAVSTQQITSSGGYFEFTVSETNQERWVGLNNGNSTAPEGVNYAWKLTTIGHAAIRENNNYITEVPVVTGDVLRITLSAGTITYLKNGSLIYTSTVPATTPLKVNAWLLSDPSTNATVTSAVMSTN